MTGRLPGEREVGIWEGDKLCLVVGGGLENREEYFGTSWFMGEEARIKMGFREQSSPRRVFNGSAFVGLAYT